jgi:hypothetical protein
LPTWLAVPATRRVGVSDGRSVIVWEWRVTSKAVSGGDARVPNAELFGRREIRMNPATATVFLPGGTEILVVLVDLAVLAVVGYVLLRVWRRITS